MSVPDWALGDLLVLHVWAVFFRVAVPISAILLQNLWRTVWCETNIVIGLMQKWSFINRLWHTPNLVSRGVLKAIPVAQPRILFGKGQSITLSVTDDFQTVENYPSSLICNFCIQNCLMAAVVLWCLSRGRSTESYERSDWNTYTKCTDCKGWFISTNRFPTHFWKPFSIFIQ